MQPNNQFYRRQQNCLPKRCGVINVNVKRDSMSQQNENQFIHPAHTTEQQALLTACGLAQEIITEQKFQQAVELSKQIQNSSNPRKLQQCGGFEKRPYHNKERNRRNRSKSQSKPYGNNGKPQSKKFDYNQPKRDVYEILGSFQEKSKNAKTYLTRVNIDDRDLTRISQDKSIVIPSSAKTTIEVRHWDDIPTKKLTDLGFEVDKQLDVIPDTVTYTNKEQTIMKYQRDEGYATPEDSDHGVHQPDSEGDLLAVNALKHWGKDVDILKFWTQRYRLWTKLDDGIKMDREGWYSVTPERLAIWTAKRMIDSLKEAGHTNIVIVDCFAGVGGNSIQFALAGAHKVIGIELDPVRVECCRNNAKVYGVENICEFKHGSFFDVFPQLEDVTAVFLSPPWEGPEYMAKPVFHVNDTFPKTDDIMKVVLEKTDNIALYMPKKTDISEMAAYTKDKEVEMEQNCLNQRLKAVTAYYGELVKFMHKKQSRPAFDKKNRNKYYQNQSKRH